MNNNFKLNLHTSNQVPSQTESEAESEVELKEEKPATKEAPVQQENLVSSTTSPGTVLDLSDLYTLEPDEPMDNVNLKEIALDANGLKEAVTVEKVESSAKDESSVQDMKVESKLDLAASQQGITYPSVSEGLKESKPEVKVDSSGLNVTSEHSLASDITQRSDIHIGGGQVLLEGDEKTVDMVPAIPQPIAVVNESTPLVQLDTSSTIQHTPGAIQVLPATTVQESELPAQVIQVSQTDQTVSLDNLMIMSQDQEVQPGPSHDSSYTPDPSIFRKDPPQPKESKIKVQFIPEGSADTIILDRKPIPYKPAPHGRPKTSPDDEYGESYVEDSSGKLNKVKYYT